MSLKPVIALITPESLASEGLTKTVEPWEDGQRLEPVRGTFEWWYFIANLEDGSTAVLAFSTKPPIERGGPLKPLVQINITRPDKTQLHSLRTFPAEQYHASREVCDLRIGENWAKGDLTTYRLHLAAPGLGADLTFTSLVGAWRPGAGRLCYGDEAHFFAWLPAQPYATVTGTLTYDGAAHAVQGTGYHDHNWGNIAMNTVLNHWYWGRARLGGYTIIAADLVAEKAYGNVRLPLFMIAKDGKILADDAMHVQVTRGGTHIHPQTGKFIDDVLTYDEPAADGGSYTVVFERKRDIVYTSLLTLLPPVTEFFAHLAGANPTYLRIQGDVTLTVRGAAGETTLKSTGLWEQMFFGSNTEATINDIRPTP